MSNNPINPNFNFAKYNIGTAYQAIIDAANQMLTAPPDVDDGDDSMFIVKPANYWIEQAKNRPVQKMLFAEFWFDNEICILFADTNLGKSILAVQIGDSISTGKPVPGFKLDAEAQPVLYFDFELTDKQFE